ncbi:DUF4123 domain-containing protein [Citrobacter freundii]|jgi:hypothetical protein|uniref:DUF4123 domain-containing protein n=1 Tax=Citrobacter freundii TaxID=546 RepID=A0A7D6ZLR6_CITFR|nr:MULTISPECIES: DUF4123 domain-containing protein [Citrobacter]MBA8061367.1 DUF4123 domain-containing protein [Citrobacter freundii]QCA20547.1 DUF4123 domain-containing protein [Citrobacter freundii]QLS08208.1 DUF4123 domain-containing protein [Citrobacter freundii]QLW76845.1 DUF4123 domain-containing protein [Citrobacter freundii]QLY63046.1 DUF4123 domain-containing protein [Citrobacter freundii]
MTTESLRTTNISKYKMWFRQAESFSTASGLDYIDVLVDQAGTDRSLQNTMRQLSPAPRWFALFRGTPESGTMAYSPIVIRLHFVLSSHRMWLEKLAEYFADTPRFTLLISPLAFDLLSRHLQALSQVQWEEQTGLLRYYDNRVFPSLFTHVLTDEQQKAFTDIALFWTWINRDGEIAWKVGSYLPERMLADKPDISRVDDTQVGFMGCISDAETLMREKAVSEISQEKYFLCCLDIAIRANDTAYFGALRDFEE